MSINLEDNQILLGNAFEILPAVPDHSIDLVVTDPPFNVLNKTDIKFEHRTDIVQAASFDEFPTYADYLAFTAQWVELVHAKLKEDASLYVFFAAQYITDLMRICLDAGMKYKGILVWHKTNPAPKIRKSGYLSSTELVLFMVQGAPPFHFLGQKKMHNFIETPICMGPERLKDRTPRSDGNTPNIHPTQKPLKIYEWLIAVSSDPGSVVLDPFAGTGTANEACLNLGRHCLGIEINPTYHAAALRRLHDAAKNTSPSAKTQSKLFPPVP